MDIEVMYFKEADAAVTAFAAAEPEDAVRANVLSALAAFEADPSDVRYRRRRYQTPPVFGFTIRTPLEEFLVLWGMVDKSTAHVYYFGPNI